MSIVCGHWKCHLNHNVCTPSQRGTFFVYSLSPVRTYICWRLLLSLLLILLRSSLLMEMVVVTEYGQMMWLNCQMITMNKENNSEVMRPKWHLFDVANLWIDIRPILGNHRMIQLKCSICNLFVTFFLVVVIHPICMCVYFFSLYFRLSSQLAWPQRSLSIR